MDYKELLKKALGEVKHTKNNSRFEVPKVSGHAQGRKTVLTNFYQIAEYIRRKPEHIQKFLLKELATSGQKEGNFLVLNRKVPSEKINEKTDLYIKKFVECRECKKPDTELVKEDRFLFIHCLACGAKYPVK